MNEQYTTENLKEGMGVAFNWFGGKVIFTSDKLEEMKTDDAIRKIYFNFDNTKIKRVKQWQKKKNTAATATTAAAVKLPE